MTRLEKEMMTYTTDEQFVNAIKENGFLAFENIPSKYLSDNVLKELLTSLEDEDYQFKANALDNILYNFKKIDSLDYKKELLDYHPRFYKFFTDEEKDTNREFIAQKMEYYTNHLIPHYYDIPDISMSKKLVPEFLNDLKDKFQDDSLFANINKNLYLIGLDTMYLSDKNIIKCVENLSNEYKSVLVPLLDNGDKRIYNNRLKEAIRLDPNFDTKFKWVCNKFDDTDATLLYQTNIFRKYITKTTREEFFEKYRKDNNLEEDWLEKGLFITQSEDKSENDNKISKETLEVYLEAYKKGNVNRETDIGKKIYDTLIEEKLIEEPKFEEKKSSEPIITHTKEIEDEEGEEEYSELEDENEEDEFDKQFEKMFNSNKKYSDIEDKENNEEDDEHRQR